ncbi:hypothetical protein Aduo_010178 [Ancylostoma duodenale]
MYDYDSQRVDYSYYPHNVPSAPPIPAVSKFDKEVFTPTNPVEIPVNGFQHGHRFRVVLKTLDKRDERFEINLKSGSDILMHFNPRLKDKVVIFNTFLGGSWQYEERPSLAFPFERKQIYTIEMIASSNNSVLIHVNGQFLYEFRHRNSASDVMSVEVNGDVHIHSVHVT